MKQLTDRPEWQALCNHQKSIARQHMRDWFDQDIQRSSHFSFQGKSIFLDYSRNRITFETLQLLFDLANVIQLPQKIQALFNGEKINCTENRPALHTALRNRNKTPIFVDGQNIVPLIKATQEKIQDFVKKIHDGEWKGITGKSIEYIVNLGIGGSYLGPLMCVEALKDFATQQLKCHFVSTIDRKCLDDILKQINPETTLFIISSKSFSTVETLTNARTVLSWMQRIFATQDVTKHFVAITSRPEKAVKFGIPREHIFELWDWVGGRYSIWSAIGLPLALMIGNKHFADFLDGAYEMDQHFKQAEFSHNMPVLLGLLSVWAINFFGAHAQAISPYSYRLQYLVPYLQQLEMESNGKGITQNAIPIQYATGAVIFGAEGCNAQHTYQQLLHQGQQLIPTDFILIGHDHDHLDLHQNILLASGLSQAQALMRGKTYEEAKQEVLALSNSQEEINFLAKHRIIPGNQPSNILFLDQITPKNLGALLALYEHKVFVQGAIWDINCFDQMGVELGKQLLPQILSYLEGKQLETKTDYATEMIINFYKKLFKNE